MNVNLAFVLHYFMVFGKMYIYFFFNTIAHLDGT